MSNDKNKILSYYRYLDLFLKATKEVSSSKKNDSVGWYNLTPKPSNPLMDKRTCVLSFI